MGLSGSINPQNTANSAFDPRLIEVDIIFPDRSNVVLNGLAVYATGTKYGSGEQNVCECTIFNLGQDLRNKILTLCSPLAIRTGVATLALKVGRQSYGTFTLFIGNVVTANITQPPDIGLTLRSLTANALQSAIVATQQGPNATSAQIAQSLVAQSQNTPNPLTLNDQSTPKQIGNFSHSGDLLSALKKIGEFGPVGAIGYAAGNAVANQQAVTKSIRSFIDDDVLVLLNSNTPRDGEYFLVSESEGMVGIPQINDTGVTVKVMLNKSFKLGSGILINSVINPAANGYYIIKKLSFEVANRDQAFWYNIEASTLAYYFGNVGQ